MGASGAPIAHTAEALVEVTASVGLTLEDVVGLLMAGVKVENLLDYVQAVAADRLN